MIARILSSDVAANKKWCSQTKIRSMKNTGNAAAFASVKWMMDLKTHTSQAQIKTHIEFLLAVFELISVVAVVGSEQNCRTLD